jgi:hypothetical protein
MPHIHSYHLDGVRIPSVSTITGSLSKEGLERWWRRDGFEECDRQTTEAKKRGTRVALMFERYRKRKREPKNEYLRTVLGQWREWGEGWNGIELVAEPHLVNTIDQYHGSPDLVFKEDKWVLGDDKAKKRFADYGLLMNEHAYAMCNMLDDPKKGLIPVPWPVPLTDIWFWSYHPVTGKLYPHRHEFDPAVYKDFLTCRAMYCVNKRAEKYFKDNAVLLPEE